VRSDAATRGEGGKAAAVALGRGSLYNRSSSSKAMHQKHESQSTISVVAVETIEREDEMLIRYKIGIYDQFLTLQNKLKGAYSSR
jgi:hypothetical protein